MRNLSFAITVPKYDPAPKMLNKHSAIKKVIHVFFLVRLAVRVSNYLYGEATQKGQPDLGADLI